MNLNGSEILNSILLQENVMFCKNVPFFVNCPRNMSKRNQAINQSKMRLETLLSCLLHKQFGHTVLLPMLLASCLIF